MSEPAKRNAGGALPGLLKGLAATARTLSRPSHTAEYPDAQPHLPPRSRGVIALLEENCTSCMLCARECPDWCIYIDSHKETIPATTPGGRDRQRNVLDRFAIDFSLCMYCGICIEVCPFDALHWSPEFEYSELDIRDLLHEKDHLAEWMPTVPPPPALDPNAAEPAEIAASNRPARGPAAARLRDQGTSRPAAARRRPGATATGRGDSSTAVGTEPPAPRDTSASIGEAAPAEPPAEPLGETPGEASDEASDEASAGSQPAEERRDRPRPDRPTAPRDGEE